MWHGKLDRESLKQIILNRVQERLRGSYNDPRIRKIAEMSAHDFAYNTSTVLMRRSYLGVVNDGFNYVMVKLSRLM